MQASADKNGIVLEQGARVDLHLTAHELEQ